MKPINLLSIGIASDHAGYDLKEAVKKYLEEQNDKLLFPWDNIKVGTSSEELRRTYLARIKHKED